MERRLFAGPPRRPWRGTYRSITVDVAAEDLVAAKSASISRTFRWSLAGCLSRADPEQAYDAVESLRVPCQPPHEITRSPCCAGELAAFAACCRNGLVTLSKAQ